jgi:hypothetical protein
VIGQLRAQMERPLADHERRRLFAVSAALLLVAAVALSLVGERPADSPARPTPADPPSRVAHGANSGRAADRPPRAVLSVARRFVAGYLRHLYGHNHRPPIPEAAPALRRRLAADTPRVSPGMRDRDPEVTRLRATELGSRWLVRATVADGDLVSFPVEVIVDPHRPRGPVVTRVLED